MVSIKGKTFEGLDFRLVRDILLLYKKHPHTQYSMKELVLKMREHYWGRDKTIITVKLLCSVGILLERHVGKYYDFERSMKIKGRIAVYTYTQYHLGFIEGFLSLCHSEYKEKGGLGMARNPTIPERE